MDRKQKIEIIRAIQKLETISTSLFELAQSLAHGIEADEEDFIREKVDSTNRPDPEPEVWTRSAPGSIDSFVGDTPSTNSREHIEPPLQRLQVAAADMGERMIILEGMYTGDVPTEVLWFKGHNFAVGSNSIAVLSGSQVKVDGDHVYFENVLFSYGYPLGVKRTALEIGSPGKRVKKAVFTHCAFLGGTQGNVEVHADESIFEDCVFANPLSQSKVISSQMNNAFWLSLHGGKRHVVNRCLFANGRSRAPYLDGGELIFTNNLCYNAQKEFLSLGGIREPVKADIIGNHFVAGSLSPEPIPVTLSNMGEGSSVCIRDNTGIGGFAKRNCDGLELANDPLLLSDRHRLIPAHAVMGEILESAGPMGESQYLEMLRRDIRNGKGTIFHSPPSVFV